MGSFFTSVQVHARALDLVIETLRAVAAKDGLEPAEANADRTMLVLAEGDWISVYDEGCEGQNQEMLDAVASALSKRASASAVTILVHDSDVLELRLFAAGKLVDRFNSHPAYFGEVSEAQKKAAAGKPERWTEILSGASAGDLAAIFRQEKLFAEQTLADFAKLIGLGVERASVGYNYADKSDARFVTLRFRHAKRPAWESEASGATRFDAGAHSPELDVSAGFPVQVACAVRNVGGASRGLRVVAWGEALERGLLALDTVELVVGGAREGNRIRLPLEKGEATFDVTIPAGHGGDLAKLFRTNPSKIAETMLASQVHANFYGKGLAKGEGTLHVGFVPTSAPDGQFAHTMRVRAHAASRKPLRAPKEVQAHLLRPLDGRGALFAMVSMDLDQRAAADVAERLVSRWATFFGRGKGNFGVFRSEPGARPRTGQARWDELVGDLRTERLVSLEHGKAGFTFGTSILPREVAGDPELPTLALWTDRDTPLASELMDEAMRAHRGVQAIVGRWDWRPSFGLDTTPYETACGIGGGCVLRRSWLTRWVRAVAVGTLWLGEELRKHVPDAPSRLVIEEGKLDEIEAMLAPVLPSQDDWRRGVDRLYGR